MLKNLGKNVWGLTLLHRGGGSPPCHPTQKKKQKNKKRIPCFMPLQRDNAAQEQHLSSGTARHHAIWPPRISHAAMVRRTTASEYPGIGQDNDAAFAL